MAGDCALSIVCAGGGVYIDVPIGITRKVPYRIEHFPAEPDASGPVLI